MDNSFDLLMTIHVSITENLVMSYDDRIFISWMYMLQELQVNLSRRMELKMYHSGQMGLISDTPFFKI